jgi:hypothetical protein
VGACEQVGALRFRDVCSLINVGTEACATGEETNCVCDALPNCEGGGTSLLVVNRTRPVTSRACCLKEFLTSRGKNSWLAVGILCHIVYIVV